MNTFDNLVNIAVVVALMTMVCQIRNSLERIEHMLQSPPAISVPR